MDSEPHPKPFGTLLVPYNGTQCAEAAYALGVQLSSDLHAPLSLLHVRERSKPASFTWASPEVKKLADEYVSVHQKLADAIRQRLDGLARSAKQHGVSVSVAVEEGAALESIIRQSLLPAVTAVVLGAHAAADLARAIVGDTALQVLRSADKPILTVKRPELVRPIKKLLLAASGFDVVDLRAAKFAGAIAARIGIPLDIMHLGEDRSSFSRIERLAAACVDEYPGLAVNIDEVDDWAARPGARDRGMADAIAEFAAKAGADLVVVGTAHRAGIARIVEGSIAECLVSRAECAVAVVPGYQADASG
jgi:nucleotide-binding universal stress UspA family protein